jgi:hypothetical protein
MLDVLAPRMIFLILLWLMATASVLIYLVSWPVAKLWRTRFAFDIPVLLILLVACITLRPGTPSNPMEAAEVAHWQSYLSAIYVAAISILLLGIAGTIRHFIFRAQGDSDTHI